SVSLVLQPVHGLAGRFRDVASENAIFGDDERIGFDLAVHPAGRRDLHFAGGDHRALVDPVDDGVHGLNAVPDDTLLADHELAATRQLAADLALDLDRIGDLELPLDTGRLADDREQARGALAVPHVYGAVSTMHRRASLC